MSFKGKLISILSSLIKPLTRWFIKLMILFIALLLLLVVLLHIPSIQNVITTRIEKTLRNTFNSEIQIGAMNLNFFGNVVLRDVLVKDPFGEKVLQSEKIDLDISIFPIIFRKIQLDRISVTGLNSYLEIDADSSKTNLDFVLKAFSKTSADPEKESRKWEILFSDISISNSNLSLHILRMLNLVVDIGGLKLLNEESNLNDLDFMVKDIDLKDIIVSLELINDSLNSKAVRPPQQLSEQKFKGNVISAVRLITVSNLNFSLNAYDQFRLSTEIPDFEGKNIYFNLLDQVIKASNLALLNSSTEMKVLDFSDKGSTMTSSQNNAGDLFIKDFIWNISSQNTEIENCKVTYDDHTSPDMDHTIHPGHFQLSNIHATIQEASLTNQHLTAKIENLSFKESKGFDLQEFDGNIYYEDDSLTLDPIQIRTANSVLQASMHIHGKPLERTLSQPDQMVFDVEVDQFQLNTKDLDYFMEDNLQAEYDIENIILLMAANGNLADFNLKKFELNLDDGISARINGQVKNLLKPELICLSHLKTEMDIKTNVLLEALDSLKSWDLNLPDEFTIRGEIDGCYNKLHLEYQLQSSMGNLLLLSDYKNPNSDADDSLTLVLNVNELDLGQVLKIDSLGKMYFRNKATLTGLKSGLRSLDMNMFVDSVYLNHSVLKNIHLVSTFSEKDFDLRLESSDSLVLFILDMKGQVIDSMIALNADMHLKHMDFGRLGYIKAPFQLSAHVTSEDRIGKGFYDGSYELHDLVINSENTFTFDTINMYLHTRMDSIFFNLQSEFITGDFSSSIPLDELDERILDFYKGHFVKNDSLVAPENSGNLKFSFFSEVPLKNLILLVPGLEEFHFSKIEGEIDERNKMSNLTINIPRIAYQNITIDSIALNMISNPEDLNYEFDVPDITYQNYTIQNLNLSGQTKMGTVNNVLNLQGASDTTLLRIGFTIDHAEADQFLFHINPDSLIINSKLWDVTGENEIIFGREKKIFGNIHISDGQQSLLILASDTLYEVNIVNYQLANLTRLIQNFNPTFEISGLLNMVSDVYLAPEIPQVNTRISLTNFTFRKTYYGNISIEAGNDNDRNVVGQLNLKNGDNILQVKGKYDLKDENSPINADVQLKFDELSVFNSFGNDFISDPKGEIRGNLSIRGNKNNLNSNGKIELESVKVLLTPVNNRYRVENETISVNNNRFLFSDFTLLDSVGHSFKMNGSVDYHPYDKFNLDLSLKADRFTVYNVNKSSNPSLYGKLIISMNAGLKGEMDNPNVIVNMSIDNGTNMIYALPPKNFDLVDSEGIVEFVDFSEEDSIQAISFQEHIGDTIFSKLNWIDLKTFLTIDKNAQFMIDMDPVSGDYIQFGGTGNMNLVVQQNHTPQITGIYEFDRGIYEVSFYGLVKKSFQFQPGSSITWSGDPYNALLNLKASYNIRTASFGLVSKEIYGLPDEETSQYRRALPYSVGINIDGRLENPLISFKIDLPEEEKSAFPLVESKLNQLNDAGHESELTRQVFGLLTIGSFIPETTGPGNTSSYGSALATTAAANSLNSILTNELNKLSGKYIKFADLDIGMQTYSDMDGGGQATRTTMDIRLSKKLFNDRVTIEAQGSFDLQNEADKYQQASDQSTVYNDFAIIYDLREKGDYKLKAFQRSGYDIIYKNTQMGGVAIIFIKEFDRYRKDRESDK